MRGLAFFPAALKRKRDRLERYRAEALHAIEQEDYELADRRFRLAGDTLGIALAAYYGHSRERAVSKALAALSGVAKESVDESIALKILDQASKQLANEKVRGAAQERRDGLIERAKARLEGVDWRRVHVHMSKLAREQPGVYGGLASERMGRKLMDELQHKSVELALMGDYHRAAALREEAGRVSPTTAVLMSEFSLCPDCLRDWIDTEQGAAMDELMRTLAEEAIPVLFQVDARSPEQALMLGVSALHLAEYLSNRGKDVAKLLGRAESFCAEAVPPESASEEERGRWTAFAEYHRGRIMEARKDGAGALAILEKVASGPVAPWNDRAREAVGRIRRRQAQEEKTRRVAGLRKECDEARKGEDGAAETAALTALASETELDLPSLERLARLRAEAGDEGWVGMARQAALRGSHDDYIGRRLADEGGKEWSSGRAREALALFRLARRIDPLPAESMSAYAAVLAAIGRPEEAGSAYEALGQEEPLRFLDSARCYLEAGEGALAIAAVQSLFTRPATSASWEEGMRLIESSASTAVLSDLARRILEAFPENTAVREVLARSEEAEHRAAVEEREKRRAGAREAARAGAWREVRSLLAGVREEVRDGEIWLSLAQANEALGDQEEAVRCYGRVPPSPVSLAGRARGLARLRRYEEVRSVLRDLDACLEPEENAGLGDDPNIRGLWAEARGNPREAARLVDDDGLLSSLLEAARARGDTATELEALKNMASRHAERGEELMSRVRALEGEMPVRTKAQFVRGRMPVLVLCDTNVLLSRAVQGVAMPEGLRGMGRPQAAERFDRYRSGKEDAKLVVTATVARELRSLLTYKMAIADDEEAAAAIEELIGRAEELVSKMMIEGVAGRSPTPSSEDLESVSSFYASLGPRLRSITEWKARRQPERSAAIRHRRKAGGKKPGRGPVPEHVDQRLLAEAASLVGGPLPGFGGVGILSDDADFRSFEREIEATFGVKIC